MNEIEIRMLPEFARWLDGLRDKGARSRLFARLRKAKYGNLGDVKPVGEDIWEMREFFGPGFRLYYVWRGKTLILMLGGGDKSTQSKDIKAAKRLAALLEQES
ncbi:MAG: type II toxin-antitoxin system RelE/ParE family toxin [Zoogloeaceae bacterium]|jgi:putative addiction module killer protein|nr:type II toxin-antitoxin system RelE/ParE family toxin [Zoogloeaceae bacterium]